MNHSPSEWFSLVQKSRRGRSAVRGDVVDLVLETPSRKALLERLRQAVPELLELNGKESGDMTMTVLECE